MFTHLQCIYFQTFYTGRRNIRVTYLLVVYFKIA